jgi:hypothetical protein
MNQLEQGLSNVIQEEGLRIPIPRREFTGREQQYQAYHNQPQQAPLLIREGVVGHQYTHTTSIPYYSEEQDKTTEEQGQQTIPTLIPSSSVLGVLHYPDNLYHHFCNYVNWDNVIRNFLACAQTARAFQQETERFGGRTYTDKVSLTRIEAIATNFLEYQVTSWKNNGNQTTALIFHISPSTYRFGIPTKYNTVTKKGRVEPTKINDESTPNRRLYN